MAKIIDPAEAKSLIQEYRKQNAAPGGPGLTTPDKQFHNGFFISRESLEDMLSNPKVVGVSLDFAKHPDFKGANENVFTTVLSGAAPAPAESPAPYVKTGNMYCETPPCPPYCTL